jgi:hypothetical protein
MTAEVEVLAFDPLRDAEEWDRLVRDSVNGTFLHTRRYLDYHGDRFLDRSLVVRTPDLVAVLPAAQDRTDSTKVVSHPGLSYGGLISDGSLRGTRMIEILTAVAKHYQMLGFLAFQYKAVPQIYLRKPADDDLYALFRLGARLIRRDLSATIELASGIELRGDRRRNSRVAQRRGAEVRHGVDRLHELWAVLVETLARRHGAVPVHSLEEMTDLIERFPDHISVETIVIDDRVVAGTVHYRTDRVLHCQYSATSLQGAKTYALDLAFTDAISRCKDSGIPFYDFGICTESAGQVLNESLYDFKTSFGARGTVCDFYELSLEG